MKSILVHDDSLLLTDSGLLGLSELGAGIRVLGTRDGKLAWVEASEEPIATDASGYHIFTEQNDFIVSTDAEIASLGGFVSGEALATEFNPYTATGVIERQARLPRRWVVESSEADGSEPYQGFEATRDHAYFLGLLSGWIGSYRGSLVLRVRPSILDYVADEIRSALKKMSPPWRYKIDRVSVNQETSPRRPLWSWVRLRSKELVSGLRSAWPDRHTLPLAVRCNGPGIIKAFADGVITVSGNVAADRQGQEEVEIVTLSGEMSLRQMIYTSFALRESTYHCKVQPRYFPRTITISQAATKDPYPPITAIVSIRDATFWTLTFEADRFYPMLNLAFIG